MLGHRLTGLADLARGDKPSPVARADQEGAAGTPVKKQLGHDGPPFARSLYESQEYVRAARGSGPLNRGESSGRVSGRDSLAQLAVEADRLLQVAFRLDIVFP